MTDIEFELEGRISGPYEDGDIISEEFVDRLGWYAREFIQEHGGLHAPLSIYTQDKFIHEIVLDYSSQERLQAAFTAIEAMYPDCRAWCLVKLTHWMIVESVNDLPDGDEIKEQGRQSIAVQLIVRDGKYWVWNLPIVEVVRNEDGEMTDTVFELEPDIISHEVENTDVLRMAFDPWRKSGPGAL